MEAPCVHNENFPQDRLSCLSDIILPPITPAGRRPRSRLSQGNGGDSGPTFSTSHK